MRVKLDAIPMREILHFLGWRGTPLDAALIAQLRELSSRALQCIEPRIELRRFGLTADGLLEGTAYRPEGGDVAALLASCHEAALLAATLGAQSERLLLQEQARSGAQAVLMDAVLSAAIEALCDQEEEVLRAQLGAQGMYLTDRFSPGYGDMPLEQTRMICDVLNANQRIGLTVSASGIMIPRKSVTAIMGISKSLVPMRPKGCAGCAARDTCTMRRNEE